MTKRGYGFFLFFALGLLAAFATGYSEIFLTALLAGMVFAFALVSTIAGLFVLRASQSITPSSVVRWEKVRIEMRLRGTLVLPVIVKITLRLPEGRTYRCADMLIGSRHALTYDDFNCPHRGLWHIGISRVMCGDIFGFFSLPLRRSRLPEAEGSVLVYPVLRELIGSPAPPAPSYEYSENKMITADQGDSFSDTRLYRDGDPLKRIHWKQTIRTRELHTRLYEMSIDKMVVLLLDNSAWPGVSATSSLGYADMAAECGAALAFYYLSAGHTVSILPMGCTDRGMLIRTPEEFEQAYALFASLPFSSGSPEETVADLMKEPAAVGSLYLISHEPDADTLEFLSALSTPQRKVSVVYPSMADSAGLGKEPQITSEGLRIIPILQPQDITERLGETL